MADKASVKLLGAKALEEELRKFGPRVAQRAADTGTRQAAMYLRRKFKQEAPKVTGTLRKAIKMKYSRRSGKAWVGLRERYYYKTLEFGRNGGPPLAPFFEKTWNRHRVAAAQLMIEKTREAVYFEAGRAYARQKSRRR